MNSATRLIQFCHRSGISIAKELRITLNPEELPAAPSETARHERWMRLALEEAQAAYAQDEVPVGAVIVSAGRVVARAHNQREQLEDPTAHAEMIALTQAAASLGSWRLSNCTLYVTLEPCPMCAGAVLQARVPTVIWGATDPKAGAVETLYQLFDDARFNHRVDHSGHVLENECGRILSDFFRDQRSKKLK